MSIQKEIFKSKPKTFSPEKGIFFVAPYFRQLEKILRFLLLNIHLDEKYFLIEKNLASLQAEIRMGGGMEAFLVLRHM